MQPRPESRIKALENRSSAMEASIEELSADTAEGLKIIRQENKQIFDHVQSGFHQTHSYIKQEVETRLDSIEDALTKQEQKLDQILALLQDKQPE